VERIDLDGAVDNISGTELRKSYRRANCATLGGSRQRELLPKHISTRQSSRDLIEEAWISDR
jgi:hypothetical protein